MDRAICGDVFAFQKVCVRMIVILCDQSMFLFFDQKVQTVLESSQVFKKKSVFPVSGLPFFIWIEFHESLLNSLQANLR